jgi:putative phosphoribosyl transferase
MAHDHVVNVIAEGQQLEGNLSLPDDARGIVLFAHGSGSSRHSPRNRFVAEELRRAGLGTLLIDLLTSAEEKIDSYNAELRFNIPMLGRRLIEITEWLVAQSATRELPVGLFGASTGAAAALIAAARRRTTVRAVVSRGGRPDLAGDALLNVTAPTLLIVGGSDEPVIRLNREALVQLRSEKQLVIVPGATHLFEEPGALEQVAQLASQWFTRHLSSGARPKAA